jgi:hypothetical protein
MYGGRISLTISFLVIFLETALGVFFGGISGYFGMGRSADHAYRRYLLLPAGAADPADSFGNDRFHRCNSAGTPHLLPDGFLNAHRLVGYGAPRPRPDHMLREQNT